MSEVMSRLSIALADRYRIEREIGAGGMATVYLARDLKHDRDVAVKVLRPELAAVIGGNRFLKEIAISARLDHPHILTLIDSGTADGFLYYVMPFVRGESLRHKLKREKHLAVDEALDITRQITSALDYAHEQGIVHRDIKPENILLHEGEAVLSDFGIAMAVKDAAGNRLTESGVSLGTPQYMSPEQATGDRPLDARSDVYSIAAVLYEMLAGEPPHTGATVQAVIAKLLTEQPTRLRVIRDSVSEAVDSAVAKALAKVPADRYSTAGDFARALGTREVPLQRSTLTRRWIPFAIGGATAAASAAALIFAREPAPPPLPDRIQLTLTGNAVAPSLSPDGTRLAFAERQCDQARCTSQLIIQDVDGTRRQILARNVEGLWYTQWTRDGHFLAFIGLYPPSPYGVFAVSTLGGEPRFLGCCIFDLLSGDTSLVSAGIPSSLLGADQSWLRRITVHGGETIDSIPLRDIDSDYYVWALTDPDRFILHVGKTAATVPELRLTDLRGRVLGRITPPFGSLGRGYGAHWVPLLRRLVVASQRELGGTEYDIVTMKVTASAIEPAVDTVLTGLDLGSGVFNISSDGERLIYSAGTVETSLSTIDLDRSRTTWLTAKPVLSSTTLLRGRLSPGGDRILLARDSRRGGTHASQLSFVPRNGGAESPILGAVENLLDFQWSPDGARIMYLHGIGGNKIRLVETDTAGRATREVAQLDQSAAIRFRELPDGTVCVLAPDRRSISIIVSGKQRTPWRVPEWMSLIGNTISYSPDGKSLVVQGFNRSFDSVVVASVDIQTGVFTRIASLVGSDPVHVTRLANGGIISIVREPKGAWVVYSIPPGRPAERLGALPFTRAEFSVSNDGRHVAMFSRGDKTDVYMIRNFGSMLRR